MHKVPAQWPGRDFLGQGGCKADRRAVKDAQRRGGSLACSLAEVCQSQLALGPEGSCARLSPAQCPVMSPCGVTLEVEL